MSDFLGIEFNWVSHLEKIISAIGGFIGIWLVIAISYFFIGHDAPLIVASMGASAVLVFAVPHGSLSPQPWPLIGGHVISALIGITCFKLVPNSFLAAALAVSLAIAAMYYLRCLHPPGAATALAAVMGGNGIESLGYQYVITPVLLNAAVLLFVAIIVNYFFSWRRYPINFMRPQSTSPSSLPTQLDLSYQDLEYALKQIDSFIDITEYELAKIYALATQHAVKMSLQSSHPVKLGCYYSNGQYGNHWSIRQVIAESNANDQKKAMITYKIIIGQKRRQIESCTQEEFAKWAQYEVYQDENSWRICK
jgi:CBS-domain-containing membrane protein